MSSTSHKKRPARNTNTQPHPGVCIISTRYKLFLYFRNVNLMPPIEEVKTFFLVISPHQPCIPVSCANNHIPVVFGAVLLPFLAFAGHLNVYA